MTGSVDSPDRAAPVRRLYELGNELHDVPIGSARWNELEAEARGLFAEDVEHVTRDGTLRGPNRFFSDITTQYERFDITYEVEFLEGDDCIVALQQLRREVRGSPVDYLTVSSGSVFRVRDGKIVFMEGHPDGRDALRAAGLDDEA